MSNTFAIIIMGIMALLTIINMIRYLVTNSETVLRQEILYFSVLCFAFICWHNERSNEEIEHYETCVSNDYTVYLNGEKVSYPDKLNIKGYNVTFDDKKKEIILSD